MLFYLSTVHHFVEKKLKEKLLPVALIHIISLRAHYTFVTSERQACIPFQNHIRILPALITCE